MKKNDLILAAVFLIIGIAALLYMNLNKKAGDKVLVTVNGQVYKELSLNKDAQLEIVGDFGNNILEIKDGYADITSATCNDGICVHSNKISNNNETIVCLPNKVIVKVISQNTDLNQVIDGVAN